MGSGGGFLIWEGCTEEACDGHAQYVPTSSFYNYTITDGECFDDGCIEGWRVNDTLTFGSITSTVTFDALFAGLDGIDDGNVGLGKTYWFGGSCVGYQSFIEVAYWRGDIKSPTIALYVVRRILEPMVKPQAGTVLRRARLTLSIPCPCSSPTKTPQRLASLASPNLGASTRTSIPARSTGSP